MTWLFAVLVVLAMGAVAVVASGRWHPGLQPVRDDRPRVTVPDGPMTGQQLRRVRFPLALRGYRMEEVDELLARLADQLEDTGRDPVHGIGGEPQRG